jgi:hypothetical protein
MSCGPHLIFKFSALSLPLFGFGTTSKVTLAPSANDVKPAFSTAEIYTNTSLPPPSGRMNPYPFVALNHFTVPLSWSPFPLCTNETRAAK